ncbi:DegV family protein [Mycobacterium sp. Y57]|uniref:DegV family protein n=1 Tax=Mycolicibacterium xanthum TaxID=2796469 RepID=UPI001C863690|nr:DegV family protein [Mycolicibacterium xanthum]MBX7431864.1 DegV family protein [Mycolicibacterium xanthum]
MTGVTVLTDSVACLSPEVRSRLGIGVVGICINLHGTLYHEGVDLTAEEFYAQFTDEIDHKTASPSVGDWYEAMQHAIDAGADGVLVVTLAGKLSSTYDSARNAAKLMRVPTVVMDSKTAAAAEGLFVRRLAEEARAGLTLDELVTRAERRRGGYHLEFVLKGLRRLARSGRMPASMARFGDAVDVKLLLTLGADGNVRLLGVVRGMHRGIDRIYRRVLSAFPPGSPGRVVVSHALLDDDAKRLAARLCSARPELEVEVALFTPVMGASTGPIIGVAWEDPALTGT